MYDESVQDVATITVIATGLEEGAGKIDAHRQTAGAVNTAATVKAARPSVLETVTNKPVNNNQANLAATGSVAAAQMPVAPKVEVAESVVRHNVAVNQTVSPVQTNQAQVNQVAQPSMNERVTPSYKNDSDNDFGGIRIPEFLKKNRNK